MLARVRALVHEADPDVVEEVKWRGVPVWSHAGIVCTGETYKAVVKLTFARGAALHDPAGLFNASLDGGTRRAIDLREGARIDAAAFKALLRAAVALNVETAAARKAARRSRSSEGSDAAATSKAQQTTGSRVKKASPGNAATVKADTRSPTTRKSPSTAPVVKSAPGEPALLAGGNPQIAKGYGDAPVQAYIAAMPGWKRAIGRQLDALIVRAVPGVAKAVKWNSPLYGVEGQGWFLGIHCYTHYVKVAFFRGARLRPPPPGPSRSADTRYLDIREDEPLDEARFVEWVRQASRLPGERM
ncbi:MAG: hypothetical protein DI564_14785 [Rhodanobacter denitrificans]|uniref:YdhG-like domain-containing protein n=1 Tax=Rhodanobacter denitrificans TaxID=666685 RepID=A0A2W5M1I9_9GAMM|nr:MAG: hypothetical protein DI564_14785 [Rhodanobacter denitrificans]